MSNRVSLKLYSPLTADWFPDDGECGWDEPTIYDDPEQLTGADLVKYKGNITAALVEDEEYTSNGVDLFEFKDRRVCEKVRGIAVKVCRRDKQLMACTTVRLGQRLTDLEMSDLLSFVSGQFSDGWGEGFEQREIRVDGGSLYVHFWQFEDFFFEHEYIGLPQERRVVPPQAQTEPSKPVLPHIDLSGPDGNIYSVLATACRVLKQAGQSAKAREMGLRVIDCSGYSEALEIISEYVQTDFSQAQPKEKQPPDRGDAR